MKKITKIAETANSKVKLKKIRVAAYCRVSTDSRFVRHNNHGEQTQYMVKDHHEAIISREDFEAAHAFIHQRATEKGVVKGSDKYQNRYTFSGKIICGECGDTFKRRIHSCTGYKYAAWCCNTHIKDKDKCHMIFVKDDDLKQAFILSLIHI